MSASEVQESPDTALAARQPMLPGLETVLDPEVLARAASRHGLEFPSDAAISYLRFKPSTSCLVAYRQHSGIGAPWYYATAFQRHSAKLAKARIREVTEVENGPGRIVLDEEAVELCVFPNDDHMRVLGRLADNERRQPILRSLVSEVKFDSKLDVIAYKPERRCVLRLSNDGAPVAVIRAYEKRSFSSAMERVAHFAARNGSIQKTIGCDAENSLIALEWREGTALFENLLAGDSPSTGARAAGARLADLHSSDPGTLPKWSATGAARNIDEIVAAFSVLRPELAGRAQAIGADATLALQSIASGSSTLHGDFDARQILLNGSCASLIDFDEAVSGPPALDIGNFIAHVRLTVLRGEITLAEASDFIDSLLSGYASRSQLPSAPDIEVATAVALARMSHEPFRRHWPNWPSAMESVLTLAERELGGLG